MYPAPEGVWLHEAVSAGTGWWKNEGSSRGPLRGVGDLIYRYVVTVRMWKSRENKLRGDLSLVFNYKGVREKMQPKFSQRFAVFCCAKVKRQGKFKYGIRKAIFTKSVDNHGSWLPSWGGELVLLQAGMCVKWAGRSHLTHAILPACDQSVDISSGIFRISTDLEVLFGDC